MAAAVALAGGFHAGMLASVSSHGGAEISGPAGDASPLVGGLGTIRNDGPVDVRVIGVRATGADVEVSLTAGGSRPGEPLDAQGYLLGAHSEAYVWISLPTDGGQPAGFTELQFDYEGPLGLRYTEVGQFSMLVWPAGFANGVAALAQTDESLAAYLQAIRSAAAAHDSGAMAEIMGDGASSADAAAFIDDQRDLVDNMGYIAEAVEDRTVVYFFESDSATDSRPPFSVAWSDWRWQVVG